MVLNLSGIVKIFLGLFNRVKNEPVPGDGIPGSFSDAFNDGIPVVLKILMMVLSENVFGHFQSPFFRTGSEGFEKSFFPCQSIQTNS